MEAFFEGNAASMRVGASAPSSSSPATDGPVRDAPSGAAGAGAGTGGVEAHMDGEGASAPRETAPSSGASAEPHAPSKLAIVPYRSGLEIIRHHAFYVTDAEPAAGSGEGEDALGGGSERKAFTEVLTFGGGAEYGVHMRGADVDPRPRPVPKFQNKTVIDVSTSMFSVGVVTDTGELYVAGLNDEGQLIHDDTEQRVLRTPMLCEQLATQRLASVSCGGQHTAVVNSVSVPLSFGSNEYGALGHSSDRSPPYRIAARVLRGLAAIKIVQVACGNTHSLLLSQHGDVFSCGSGIRGALGHGDTVDAPEATRIKALFGVPVAQVAAGDNFSAAVSASGLAYTWGANKVGQCGLPVATFSHTVTKPTRVEGLAELVQQVACGDNHTVWVSRSGRAYAAGSNSHGQLGIGTHSEADAGTSASSSGDATPTRPGAYFADTPQWLSALGERRLREAACGSRHTLLLSCDGLLFSCGDCSDGQTGVYLPATAVHAADAVPASPAAGSGGTAAAVSRQPFETLAAALAPRSVANHCIWTPQCMTGLSGAGIFRIAAAGNHSLAVRVVRGSVLSTPPGCLPRGTMMFVDTAMLHAMGKDASETQNFAPLRLLMKDVLSQYSSVGGSFLAGSSVTLMQVSAPQTKPAFDPLTAAMLRERLSPDASPHEGDARAGVAQPVPASSGGMEVDSTTTPAAAAAAVSVEGSGSFPHLCELSSFSEHDIPGTAVVRARVPCDALRAMPIPVLPGVAPALSSTNTGMRQPTALVLDSSGIDVLGLDAAYTSLSSSHSPELMSAWYAAASAILDEVEPLAHDLTEPDALRGLLALWMTPPLQRTTLSDAVMTRFYLVLLALPKASRDLLISWIGVDMTTAVFRRRLLRPMQAHLSRVQHTCMLGNYAGVAATSTVLPRVVDKLFNLPAHGAAARSSTRIAFLQSFELIVRVMRLLYRMNESLEESVRNAAGMRLRSRPMRAAALLAIDAAQSSGMRARADAEEEDVSSVQAALENDDGPMYGLVRASEFYNPDVNRLPDELLRMDYNRWVSLGQARLIASPMALCAYPFLLNAATKRRILLLEAVSQMQSAAESAMARSFFMESPYLILNVRREHTLEDTLSQLLAHPPAALRKQLRVVFDGEEGIDEGGPRRELFQLLIREIFNPQYALFTRDETSGAYWFAQAMLPGREREYFLVGLLVGLAIYNGITLDVHFPQPLYKKLLNMPVTFYDLCAVNPELGAGMRKLLEYEGHDTEELFCLTFEASYDMFGAVENVELVPGGKSKAVTSDNKQEYIAAYTEWYLNTSIHTAFGEFARGFGSIMSGPSLSLFRPEELQLLVSGSPVLDFKELQRVTRYEGGGWNADHPYVRMFWRVVHSLTPQQQRDLLVFVTGCPRAPVGGLGQLAFTIQRAGPDTNKLPTASVCFHVLLLPEYASEAKLRDRLTKAIEECTGFGLK